METKAQTYPENVELRAFSIERSANPEKEWAIKGYAAKFNNRAPLDSRGQYFEEIAPGFFSEALATSDIRLLLNHDPNHVLGRTKSGTLLANEDSVGLYIIGDLPKSRPDIKENLERGDIDQMSFAFTIKEEKWTDLGDGVMLRTLVKADKIYDVTIATYPFYENTNVQLSRSAQSAIAEFEKSKTTPKHDDSKQKQRSAEALLHKIHSLIH